MFLPIYQLIMLLIFFAGFSALLIVPGSKDPPPINRFSPSFHGFTRRGCSVS